MKLCESFELNNTLALVTGGGTGIGYGICKSVIEAGGRVVMTGRREDVLKAACDSLGERASFIRHDVDDLHSIPDFIERVEEEQGPIGILVNNAGAHLKKPAAETTDEEFDRVLQTHLHGGFALSRECGRRMIERGEGSIVQMLSMAAVFGLPLVCAYTAAKSAMTGLVRGLAVEFSPHGVRVNGIAPGFIRTPMTDRALGQDPDRKARVLARTPMGRLGEPQDIGRAVVYLASPAGRFVTGVVLPIDGGASIGF